MTCPRSHSKYMAEKPALNSDLNWGQGGPQVPGPDPLSPRVFPEDGHKGPVNTRAPCHALVTSVIPQSQEVTWSFRMMGIQKPKVPEYFFNLFPPLSVVLFSWFVGISPPRHWLGWPRLRLTWRGFCYVCWERGAGGSESNATEVKAEGNAVFPSYSALCGLHLLTSHPSTLWAPSSLLP